MAGRRFSEERFGPTIVRLMAETGTTYRAPAAKTELSPGYLNHLVHGNRPVPSNDVIEILARALDIEPEHFREGCASSPRSSSRCRNSPTNSTNA